ncbi:MAG TPA: hypothetical protein VFU15_09430, partial [Bacteroidia bacterium]|nr:hypothetical protein [Bacteroidia bacterium]
MEFHGTVGTAHVRLLAEQHRNRFCGIYYYEKIRRTIYLSGITTPGGVHFDELTLRDTFDEKVFYSVTDETDTTGAFDGAFTADSSQFTGQWVSHDGKKKFPFSLSRDTIAQMDLPEIVHALRTCRSEGELHFLLCTQLVKTLDNFSFFTEGGGDWDTTQVIGPQNMQVKLFTKNLFGNDSAEKLLYVNFCGSETFLFAFYKCAGRWKKIPGCVFEKQGDESNRP